MVSSIAVAAVLAVACTINAQTTTTERALSTLSPQVNAAPSLYPTITDPTAPNPQDCPGYIATGVSNTSQGFTAHLTIAGSNCQAFGNDIADLFLEVNYQTKDRLNVKIYPEYLSESNTTRYRLPDWIVPEPQNDGTTTESTSNLKLEWSNDPTFQFRVLRTTTGEELFSTYGHVIVFEDQFLEVATNMVKNYNVYGLAENIHDFLLGDNYTQTFYAVDNGNQINGNVYGTHPFYQETRYHNGSNTTAHGVYARNAHGQEWLLRENNITYRTIGGSFDLYFLSGQEEDGSSSALQTIRQYQSGCVGLPAMQQFWTHGFHQCRWGYENISIVQGIVDSYREANIPLETMWNDIDIYTLYRDFTNNPETYPAGGMQEYVAGLHANGQHYVPIVDSNLYIPDPENASDAYAPYQRGADLQTFIRDSYTGDFYAGDQWPGFSTWADWLVQSSRDWWTYELMTWHNNTPFDGIWIDLSEASSYCVGSCGGDRITENPVAPPFLLPGEPYDHIYAYPEGFNVTNATEAASASAASIAQASASSSASPLPIATTFTKGRTEPTPGVRNLNYPPYVLNSDLSGHSLPKGAISPSATHNDPSNTTEYEMHNLFGLQISNATYYALLSVFPGKRPFTIGRSTFASSGRVTGHWGGDNTSTFGSMFLSIAQALSFMMAGIPMFGADTCGFTGNSDFDLCSRWMELSAFFPFYRNHNEISTISQEAFRWSSTAEASRRAMQVRYTLLNYLYTLMHYAHTSGDTVMRALAWEFPLDQTLKGTYSQFMLGPSILVTPVLVPNVDYVNGVFPGIGQGTTWYDWYTLQAVEAKPQENVTMSAPLEHINVHVRGGSILPLQTPGYTTSETRNGTWGLLVALGEDGTAAGSLYLDDGESLTPNATKLVTFKYAQDTLTTSINGTYAAAPALGNVTIAGASCLPSKMAMSFGGEAAETSGVAMAFEEGVLRVTGLESVTWMGAWEAELEMKFTF